MVHTTTVQKIFRIILGLFLTIAGIGHLTWARVEFLAQVPDWLPVNGDLVVVLSGLVEIMLGLAIIFWRSKREWVGCFAAIFFILVFPGNISQYTNHIDGFGLDTDTKRLVRLFFQPVLIVWILWSSGGWKAWRQGKLAGK